jgi:hypothetical protein
MAPLSDPNPFPAPQRERLERLRQPTSSVAPAIRLADQIDAACDATDRVRMRAAMARHAQDTAWDELCQRGWPDDLAIDEIDVTAVYAWIAVWTEFTSLPVAIESPRDLSRLQWIENRLTECELPLQRNLPPRVWLVVGRLDPTGRATLSYLLSGVVALLNARKEARECDQGRDDVLSRYSVFRHEARVFGVRAPLSPHDVRAWRGTARALRLVEM